MASVDTIGITLRDIFTYSEPRYKKVRKGNETRTYKLPPKQGKHTHLLYYLLNNPGGKLKYSGRTILHVPQDGSQIDPYEVFTNLYKDLDNSSEGVQYILKERKFRSSNYNINITINPASDYIKMEFSIPKILFGTNVLQFCVNPTSNYYKGSEHNGFLSQIDECYYFLITFIKDFLSEIFGGLKIDYQEVEIYRLDICFNQVFSSLQDVNRYITYQKHHRKKYAREGSGSTRNNGNIRYQGRNKNFTIYQKGLEFDVNDKKNIYKNGGIPNVPITNLERTIKELAHLANRTLRYEYQFKKKALTKIYKENVFRVNCPIHQRNLTAYKAVRAEKHRLQRKGEPLDKFKEKFRQKMRAAMENSVSLRLEVDSWRTLHNSTTTTEDSFVPFVAEFCIETFRACVLKLHEQFLAFQVTNRPPYAKIIEDVDHWNSTIVDKKLKIPKPFKVWVEKTFSKLDNPEELLFEQYLQEDKKSGMISNGTFYNYKKYLKWLGIGTASALNLDIVVPLDYEAYHDFHHLQFDFFQNYMMFNEIMERDLQY